MKLATYLTENQITAAEFGRRCGYRKQRIHDWLTGRRFPRPKALAVIEEQTGGAVRAADFMEDAQ